MIRIVLILAVLCLAIDNARAQMPPELWKLNWMPGYSQLAIASKSNRMVLSNGTEAILMDADTGKKLSAFNCSMDGFPTEVAISPNGNYIAFGYSRNVKYGEINSEGKVVKWSYLRNAISTLNGGKAFVNDTYQIGKFVISDDGILVGICNRFVVFYIKNNRSTEIRLGLDREYANEFLLSPDGQWVAFNPSDGNTEHCTIRKILDAKNDAPFQFPSAGQIRKFSADGKYLATVTAQGKLNIIDLPNKRIINSRQFCSAKDRDGQNMNCWGLTSVDFKGNSNYALLLEQNHMEHVSGIYSRYFHRGNLIVFDVAGNEVYQVPVDTVSYLQGFDFTNSGAIVITKEIVNKNDIQIKARRFDDLRHTLNAQFDEPPRITTTVSSSEITSPTLEYVVEACIQQRSKGAALSVEIKVNNERVFFIENPKEIKPDDCGYALKQKITLNPGVSNKVNIIAINDKGQASYTREVKCTVPRKLPAKDESISYAAMNILLIHDDDDRYNAEYYKRFLETEGSFVTLTDLPGVADRDLSVFDLIVAWVDLYSLKDNKHGPVCWDYNRMSRAAHFLIIEKIKDSGKPFIAIGNAIDLLLTRFEEVMDFSETTNHFIEISETNTLSKQFKTPENKKTITCEVPFIHFALRKKDVGSGSSYIPFAAGLDNNGDIVHPIVRFKSKYGLFGLTAPFELWTPEAKDLLMAFLSSFCEHCPRAKARKAGAVSIVWEQPATATIQTDNASYLLKACLSEPKSTLTEVALLLNGTRVNVPERGIKAVKAGSNCANLFEYNLTLRPGENKIQINAISASGTASSDVRTIYFQKAEMPQTAQRQSSGKRLALVIGNAAYTEGGVLRNPVNDATDIAATLKSMGFDVLLHTDLNLRQMNGALQEFGNKLKSYQVGLFYYAGHGVQVGGENYLVPIDAKLASEGETRYECVPSGILLAKMEEAATTNVIILDACRNNPFARSWSRSAGGAGLAAINAPKGTFIGFATSPGSTASDGSDRNGVFTTAFLKHIKTTGLTIDQIFNRINRTVDELTNGSQTPWKSSSLQDDFYFNR